VPRRVADGAYPILPLPPPKNKWRVGEDRGTPVNNDPGRMCRVLSAIAEEREREGGLNESFLIPVVVSSPPRPSPLAPRPSHPVAVMYHARCVIRASAANCHSRWRYS